jgi:hypothetical protein
MGSNMSMYIPHINTKQNLLKQVSKMEEYMIIQNILSNKNIAQDSTYAKVTSPSYDLCKN